jgi:hypothetical protein
MSSQSSDNMGLWIKQQLDKLGQSEAPEMLVSTLAQPSFTISYFCGHVAFMR